MTPSQILAMVLVFGLEFVLAVAVVVLVVLERIHFRAHWKLGIWIGGVLFVLLLPAQIFTLVYLDLNALMPAGPGGAGSPGPEFLQTMVYVGICFGVVLSVAKIGWTMLTYIAAVTQWTRVRENPFPGLSRTGTMPWRGIEVGAAFGVLGGLVSCYAFQALGVNQHEFLREFGKLFPHMEDASLPLRSGVMALAFSAAAIAEELTYRGVVQGLLLRWSGGNKAWIAGSFVLVSALWAVPHLFNTDMEMVKLAQIFLLGLGFCELARRYCLESAIAAHVALNLAAVAWGLVVQV